MKRKSLAVVLCLALLSLIAVAPAQAAITIPVSGSGSGSTFTGTFTLVKFVVQGGALQAVGTLTGVLTSAAGVTTSVVQNIVIPVTGITGTCQILHLELGPLDVTLLGLVIHLDKIVLDISAQPGGGLLGNLLCSIAGALNNLNALANLLNPLLALL